MLGFLFCGISIVVQNMFIMPPVKAIKKTPGEDMSLGKLVTNDDNTYYKYNHNCVIPDEVKIDAIVCVSFDVVGTLSRWVKHHINIFKKLMVYITDKDLIPIDDEFIGCAVLSGKLTLTSNIGESKQFDSYSKCLSLIGSNHNIVLMDSDEFLEFGTNEVKYEMPSNCDQVLIPMNMIKTNKLSSQLDMIESNADSPIYPDRHVRPLIKYSGQIDYTQNYFKNIDKTCDVYGNKVSIGFQENNMVTHKIYINHYWAKSTLYAINKILKKTYNTGEDRNTDDLAWGVSKEYQPRMDIALKQSNIDKDCYKIRLFPRKKVTHNITEYQKKGNVVSIDDQRDYYNKYDFVIKEGITIRQKSVFDLFDNRLELKAVNRIVDLGCGPGHIVNHLTNKGYNVIGYDLSDEHIKFGLKKYPHLQLFQRNIFDVEGSYDLIIMTDVLEHIRMMDHSKLIMKLSHICFSECLLYINQPSASAIKEGQIIDTPVQISYLIALFDKVGFKLKFLEQWNIDYYHILFLKEESLD